MTGDMAPAMAPAWSFTQATLMFLMWWVMMFAMMLPSAAPMILLFASVAARAGRSLSTVLFVSGYLLVWGGFSLAATAIQWELTRVGIMNEMRTSSSLTASLLLLMAGVYQLTPAKMACLRHCQSPMQFVTENWRGGYNGALSMGLRHGGYCLGCCWGLMTLLFVGGVMNLAWIGLLSVFVLIEKLAPVGLRLSQASAGLMIITGSVMFGVSLS